MNWFPQGGATPKGADSTTESAAVADLGAFTPGTGAGPPATAASPSVPAAPSDAALLSLDPAFPSGRPTEVEKCRALCIRGAHGNTRASTAGVCQSRCPRIMGRSAKHAVTRQVTARLRKGSKSWTRPGRWSWLQSGSDPKFAPSNSTCAGPTLTRWEVFSPQGPGKMDLDLVHISRARRALLSFFRG